MFHFCFHWDLLKDTVVARRIPCLCDKFYKQLSFACNDNVEPNRQVKISTFDCCIYFEVMGELNEWQIVKIDEKDEFDRVDINVIYQDALIGRETAVENDIKIMSFGSVSGDEHVRLAMVGVYLLQWQSKPFAIHETTFLEACGELPMPIGTIDVQGSYWQ